MKEMYLDIMEKSLSAYTDQRIREYIDEVKRDGLTEHGFPRLASNIGILIAYGRRTDLLPTFVEIMDLCCEQMPRRKAANDFSIREVCCCLMLLEQKRIVEDALLKKWKGQLSAFDPWNFYDDVDDYSGKFMGNWVMFAAVSEYVRGVYCGIDTAEFVDWQIPSQLESLDCNGMYQDDPPFFNHTVYDLVPRFLMTFLLRAGYKGKYADKIEQALDSTADLTLKMQSVTGELAFGGRSNQFLHNETLLASYCEMEAARFAEKGDCVKASEFKAAALLAAEATLKYLNLDPISHIKNRYDISTKIGCESYGYFNKYMITVASNAYASVLFGNDGIAPSVAPAEKGGYVISTSDRFHKTFLSAGGYCLEIDTNADFHYDANGLGRVHKKDCPAALCLSVPFARKPNYVLESKNPMPMSICCYAEKDGRKLLGAEKYAQHSLVKSESDKDKAWALFHVKLSLDITVAQKYTVSQSGVDISLSGCEQLGFVVPVFHFDGKEYTKITVCENEVAVAYQGAVCRYQFDGRINPDFKIFNNRNGSYKAFAIEAKELHIEMESANE
jgi:hypothetical protein